MLSQGFARWCEIVAAADRSGAVITGITASAVQPDNAGRWTSNDVPTTIRTPNRRCPGHVSADHAEAENCRAVKRLARLQFGGRIIRMVWTIGIMLRLQRDGVRLTIDAADAGEIAFHEIARVDLDARLVRQAL